MDKKKLFLILSGAVLLPAITYAATLEGMAASAAQTALKVASGVVVVMWVVAGIIFLSAAGDPGKLSSAKTALIAAVIGTVVVIVANGAVGLVGGIFGI